MSFTIAYTKDEYKAFQEDIKDYCCKYHRYRHYKDKNKYGIFDCNYKPSLANKRKVMFDKIDKFTRKLLKR